MSLSNRENITLLEMIQSLDNLDNFSHPIISIQEEDDRNAHYSTFPFSPKLETIISNERNLSEKFEVISKTRKYKEDNIRKKIKTGFHKILRNIINKKLKEAGSKYIFESLPQIFISNITKKTNFEVMHLTIEELFDYTYQNVINCKTIREKDYIIKHNETAKKKHMKNMKTLEYLKANRKISQNSDWDNIKEMKYIDLLKAYFNSNEFQQVVLDLRKKKETNIYIHLYFYFASTYVEYFNSYISNEDSNNNIVNNNEYYFPEPLPFPHLFINEEINKEGFFESINSSLNNIYDSTNSFTFHNDSNLIS